MVRRLLAVLAAVAASFFVLAGPASAAPTAYTPTTAPGTVSDASPAAGATFTFAGDGFAAGATVTITLAGDQIATATANSNGAFSVSVKAPTAAGTYVLAANGTGADGAPLSVTATIQVLAASGSAAGLPRTGTEVATQLWIAGGLLALGAGLIALTVVRRRDGAGSIA